MKTMQQVHFHATNNDWNQRDNEEFEKSFVRDTLLTVATGLLIASVVIAGLFYLTERLIH